MVAPETLETAPAAVLKPGCLGCGQRRLCSLDLLCTECHETLIGPPALFAQEVSHADVEFEFEI